MIRLKDLQNRVYRGKNCIRFEYEYIYDIDSGKSVFATFKKMPGEASTWSMSVLLERTRDKDAEVYNFTYALPKDNVSLELVAAIGLRYFQLYLKEEIQMKTAMDFFIGEVIEGVVG